MCLSINKICDVADRAKKEEGADDEEEVPFPTFGKTIAGCEAL
jgi:hypothetical protein